VRAFALSPPFRGTAGFFRAVSRAANLGSLEGMSASASSFAILITAVALLCLAAALVMLVRMRHAMAWAAERESQQRAVIDAAADAIITIDARHCIVSFNPAAERMFGYGADQVIGTDLGRLMPERYRQAHSRHVVEFGNDMSRARAMNSGREVNALRADGAEFPVEASISRATVRSHVLYTVVMRDVTERRRIDEARSAAERELRESQWALRTLTRKLDLVREEERARLARQLHEGLGQPLMALKMEMAVLEGNAQGASVAVVGSKVDALVDELVYLVREMASELRPPMLDDLGLCAALEWLADDVRARYGVQVSHEIDEVPVEREVATVLYRVAEELFENGVQRGCGARLSLSLHKADGRLILTFGEAWQDDGVATADDAAQWLAIRERVAGLGGYAQGSIDSPGHRQVVISFPEERAGAGN
jgi:PAS domain S-box-containing protein